MPIQPLDFQVEVVNEPGFHFHGAATSKLVGAGNLDLAQKLNEVIELLNDLEDRLERAGIA